MSFAVIPQNLSIGAMRSSGYRDSAHAIAELVDNAIQAGEAIKGRTEVEVICIDRVSADSGRRRIHSIAVYDNASGMDKSTLRCALQFGNGTHLAKDNQLGIGKFGMGLPNSSISQCLRVEVWSWQRGKVYHCYLDVEEIRSGTMVEVPVPRLTVLPNEWLKLVSTEPSDHGTLVVWSELDRVTWKQSKAFLRNAEFLLGRVYRYFLHNKAARIRLAAYEETDDRYVTLVDSYIRPNDPLYLMTGTSAPAPFDKTPAFEPFEQPDPIFVSVDGKDHKVEIRGSICSKQARSEGGSRPIGRHARHNQGVSVIRANRELQLNKEFDTSYDPRERWWGIEVRFEPGLDDVFGVSNNKQGAANFTNLDEDEDAKAEGLSVSDYRKMLETDLDPRRAMYVISNRINRMLKAMRSRIARMKEGERLEGNTKQGPSAAELAATTAVRRRRERIGDTGRSDRDETKPSSVRTDVLTSAIEHEGVNLTRAREIAVDYVHRQVKFRLRHADIPSPALFDVTSMGGLIIITLNTRHPGHGPLFEALRAETDAHESVRRDFMFLLTAWARLEDEASDKLRSSLEDARLDWGKLARDFFENSDV